MLLTRIAALTEILLVLALGNVLGAALYPFLVSDAVLSGTASDNAMTFASGLLIFLRLGSAAAIGLTLLYFRSGKTPRNAGLTLNNKPLSELLRQGFVLGLISSFLVGLLFAVHSIFPLGEGLAAWWTYDETPINTAFVISVLATSVLIPPLTEEILMRGYNRVRLVESFGPMSGVVLTGLVFGLSHTRYFQADGMMLLFLCEILLSSILWTYVAQKTGSILPSFIAHAMSNGIATAILFNVWLPFLIVCFVAAFFLADIKALLQNFKVDWQEDKQRGSFWQGLVVILAIFAIAILSLSQLGRMPTLIMLGAGCLTYTIAFTLWERFTSGEIKSAI